MSTMTTNEAALVVAGENATAIEGIVSANAAQDATIVDLMGTVSDFRTMVKDGEGQLG